MKYLIYGAGTIGITYGWLLSQKHQVDILVKVERYEEVSQGIHLFIKDLRIKSQKYEEHMFFPNCVTEVVGQYDGILVAVNRCQLQSVLPELSKLQNQTKYFAFMQNNWNIKDEVEAYLPTDKYIIAFPSSIGGGCQGNSVEVIVFDEATRLGGGCQSGITDIQNSFTSAGIKSEYDDNIFHWLKVHYLQQSITAGAVLESGSFSAFAKDYSAVKKMVKAFREGIAVCRYYGVDTNKTFPANLFRLPVFIVARTMQKMFLDSNTTEMVSNHMKKGLPEWISGYYEVLADGRKNNLTMTVWASYEGAVEKYVQSQYSTK